MRARSWQTCLLAAAAVAFAGTALAQSGSPDIGTWKINFENTRAATADGGHSSLIARITNEAAGAGVRCTVAVVSSADGSLRNWEFSGNYDGKDDAIKGNSQYGDVVALTRVDENKTRYIYKIGGKVTVIQTAVVSSDGMSMTVSSAGTDIQGNAVNGVAMYDKQ